MTFLPLAELTPFHSAYLSCLGRAVAVCQHFEDCGRHVAVVWAVTDANVVDLPPDRLREIARRLGSAPLGRCLSLLGRSPDFDRGHFDLVDRGREARNWFAHEAAACVYTVGNPAANVTRLRELHSRIEPLCAATAILAVASYEICEREPAPRSVATEYRRDLQAWVFEPIIDWIGVMAQPQTPATESPEE